MENYMEVDVRHIEDNGERVKKVTTKLTINAMSFTEAEAKALKRFDTRELPEVVAIKKAPYTEIIGERGEKYWNVRAKYEIDESEKGFTEVTLVRADTIADAQTKFKQANPDAMCEIVQVTKTKIEEVC
jgi:hypothetical protein